MKRRNKSVHNAAGASAGERRRRHDLALWCQSRMAEGGIVPPHSVLAPGTALRSVPTVALPSAQVRGIVVSEEGLSNRIKKRGYC